MKIYQQRLHNQTLTTDEQAIIAQQEQQNHYLYLDFDTRQRSRFKAETQNGEAVGIDLPRTETLKDGCVLRGDDGQLIQIKASKQSLVAVTADDNFTLMKGAYHLGNRHVPLMITPDTLYFEPDHVLEAMLKNLDLKVHAVQAPFEPETGAYKTANTHSHSEHSHSGYSHSEHSHSGYSHSAHSHSHSHGNKS